MSTEGSVLAAAVAQWPDSGGGQSLREPAGPESREDELVSLERVAGDLADALADPARGGPPPRVVRAEDGRGVVLVTALGARPLWVELAEDGEVTISLRGVGRGDLPGTLGTFYYEPAFVADGQAWPRRAGDMVRIFIGRNVFLEGHLGTVRRSGGGMMPASIDEMLPLLSCLPRRFLTELGASLEAESIRALIVYREGVWANPRTPLRRMRDPVAAIGRAVDLMVRCAVAYEALATLIPRADVSGGIARPTSVGRLLHCRACSVLHLPQLDALCPSCGAPRSAPLA